jgi:hypothetical protein
MTPGFRRPSLYASLTSVGIVAVAVATAARKLGDFDLPWHLAFGRLVATTSTIPSTDDLAYTHRPIEYAEFVADLLLYGLMRLGGPLGLQILGGLLTAGVVVILSWGTNRDRVAGTLVACGTATAASAWLIVRPATFSFVLLGLTLFAVETHRKHGDSKRGRIALASVVPLQALWSNLHGFVVVGVAVVAVYATYRILCAVARGRLGDWLPQRDSGDLRWATAMALAALAASMLNISGPKLLLGPLRAMPDTGRITEWAPTTLRFLVFDEPAAAVFALIVIAALVFGKDRETKRRTPAAWDVAMVALSLLLAVSAVRLVAVGAILSAPVVARRLAPVIPVSAVTRAAAAFSPFLLAAWMVLRGGTAIGVGFEPDHFPEPAVQYIREHKPNGHMWNSLVYGGYLAWRLYPEHRVLMDGRTGWVHEPRVVTLAHQSEHKASAFNTLVEEFDIQWAVCRAFEGEQFGVPLAADRRWAMVFWDDVSAVYVLRTGANKELAASGYRVMRHLTPMLVALKLGVSGKRTGALTHDAILAARQAPDSPRAAFLQGCAAVGRRDGPAFGEALDRVRALSTTPEPAVALEHAWASVSRGRQ